MKDKMRRLVTILCSGLLGIGGCYLYASWTRKILAFPEPRVLLDGTFYGVLAGVALSLVRKEKSKNDSIFGDARFATREEVRRASLLRDKGIVLGESGYYGGELLRYSGDRHILVEGPTRSGKGRGIIIPTLLATDESVFVIDLKGENYDITAGIRATYGTVFRFEPGVRGGARYNPIAEIRDGDQEIGDIQALSEVVCDEAFEKDPHWNNAAAALLTTTIFYLRHCAAKEDQTLFGVVRTLSRPGLSLKEILQEMFDCAGTEVLQSMVSMFLTKTEGERASIVSTLLTKLKVFWDPVVQENTATSDFSLTDLVSGEKPVSLYVIVQPQDVDQRLKVLLRILVDQLGRILTSKGISVKRRQKLLLVLDEFPSLGRLKFFDTALSYIAGYGVRALVVCQSLKQLTDVYGQAQSLSDNCYLRVFFTPNAVESAEYITRCLGEKTVSYSTEARSGRGVFSSQMSEHIIGRPLLSIEELLCLPGDELIILVAGNRPVRAKRLRYDEHPLFRDCALEPPERRTKTSWECFPEEEGLVFDADELQLKKVV